MQQEGFRWNRKWVPPSMWPKSQLLCLVRLQPIIDRILRPQHPPRTAEEILARGGWVAPPTAAAFMNRHGAIVPAYKKSIRVQHTDGVLPSALIITWAIPSIVVPVPPPTDAASGHGGTGATITTDTGARHVHIDTSGMKMQRDMAVMLARQ